jgi:hypothetical protein
MYEEDSKIPFVPVPKDEEMPELLFMFESRETGEFEPDQDGNPLPIVQMDLYQYANMSILKNALTSEVFDEVRSALGLESLLEATEKGNKITSNIKNTLEK